VALLALAVAGGGIAVAARGFQQPDMVRPAGVPAAGKIAFDMAGDIFVMNADGTGVENITRTERISESAPDWSPDGRRLVYVRCAECTTSDLYVMNADGTEVRRLTQDPALDGAPTWSPDGSMIAYQTDATGTYTDEAGYSPGNEDLWVIGADGQGKRLLVGGADRELSPAWSPGGSEIAYWRISSSNLQSTIELVAADGTAMTTLTDPRLWAGEPVWSPDGRRIAFDVIGARKTPSVYAMNADGSNVRRLTDDPASVLGWSPNGARLLVVRFSRGRDGLYTLDVRTGAITDLYVAPEPQEQGVYIHNGTWSPVPSSARTASV
jgi:Tol biopolymer transport system component